jgi:hypothetical protein
VHQITDRKVLNYLRIQSNLTLADVSEYSQGDDDLSIKYIALRFSDKQLFLADGSTEEPKTSIVPIVLNEIFDHDVVSFARTMVWPSRDNTWISVIGCVDMYNSGGAIDSIRFEDVSDREISSLVLQLMGPGKYWVVYSSPEETTSLGVISSCEIVYADTRAIQVFHLMKDGTSQIFEAKLLEFTIDPSSQREEIVASLRFHV